MIQDKIFFDEKDPTGLSYNTPFTFYGSYQGRLWSKSPSGSIQYYTQNSDLSAYATTGSNQFSGSQTITGSLTVTGTITGTVAGTTATASYVEYTNVANKPALVSGSAQITALGFASTGSSNTFQANQTITGSLFITQNLVVAGSSSIQYISSSVVDIADNIITVNAFNPGVRFGGLAVIDSGSSPQVSGSLLFDSIKDQWIFVHQNQSVVTSSVLLMGPETYNDLGNESYISANRLPKGSGVEHLRDSNITDTGTVVSVNSNTQVTGSLGVTGSLAVVGAGTFSSTVTATNGTFINGSNQNTLGSGTLELLTYAGYNSSANQSITLGLAIDEAVDNSRAYQYNLGASGNATGQNLILTSKRRGTTDLTVLTINGTGGAVTLTGALNGTSAAFSGNIESTSLSASIVAGRTTGYGYFGNLTGGAYSIVYGDSHATKPNRVEISGAGGVYVLNAATFSSSVTAGGQTSVLYSGYDSNAEGLRLGYDTSYYNAISATFSSTAANNKMNFVVSSGNGTRGTVMTLQGNGYVGIGLASPTGQLSIKNQISNGLNPVSSYAATNGLDGQNFFNGYYAQNSDGLGPFPRYFDIVSTGSPDGSNGGSNIRFFTNPVANNSPAVERMRITSNGDIFVYGTTTQLRLNTSSNVSIIQFWKDSTPTYANSIGNGIPGNSATNDLVFSTYDTSINWNERMRITSGGVVRISSFTSNGLVGTDASGNLRVVNTNYTEIATGTITYSMNSGAPWGINNSFPATIRDYNDDGMAGSAGVATSANLGRGVTFDLGSAKAVRRIVERGYPTKNLNIIVVQYSTDNSTWTDVHAYYHIYGNTQKDMQFNPTGAISARYWRWFIHDWTEREVQNYYTYEAIIYT
jgi:hypothetical protein